MRVLPFWVGRVTSTPSDQEDAYTFNIQTYIIVYWRYQAHHCKLSLRVHIYFDILKHLRQFVQSDWFLDVLISHDKDTAWYV